MSEQEKNNQIVATVAQQLKAEFGEKGFEKSSITRMMQFAQLFPDEQIVASLARQLPWSARFDNFLEEDEA